MKLFVTGATGFIGSHVVKQALAFGHSVLAHRRSPSSTPRIAWDRQPEWLDKSFQDVTPADIRGCDVLLHLAAHTGNVPYDTHLNCLRWNLMEPLALFEQALLSDIKHFVVGGSCFEYGQSGERYNAIPTDAPLLPTNSYAVSKAAASIAFSQWAEENHSSLVILRVFHVYGEGEPESRLWPSLRRAAFAGIDFPMTKSEQIRDFIPVEQVASTFLAEAESLLQKTERIVCVKNLGSGCPQTIRQFSQFWWQHWQASGNLRFGALPYRKGEVMCYVPEL